MTTGKPIPFTKNPKWNIFDLFSEYPNAKKGNLELKKVCDNFLREHERIAKKYQNEGASDSAVREIVIDYIRKNIY